MATPAPTNEIHTNKYRESSSAQKIAGQAVPEDDLGEDDRHHEADEAGDRRLGETVDRLHETSNGFGEAFHDY